MTNETRLLVLDQKADKFYKNKNIVVRGTQRNVIVKTSAREEKVVAPPTPEPEPSPPAAVTNGHHHHHHDDHDNRSVSSAASSSAASETSSSLPQVGWPSSAPLSGRHDIIYAPVSSISFVYIFICLVRGFPGDLYEDYKPPADYN